jgi:hypothetical protein
MQVWQSRIREEEEHRQLALRKEEEVGMGIQRPMQITHKLHCQGLRRSKAVDIAAASGSLGYTRKVGIFCLATVRLLVAVSDKLSMPNAWPAVGAQLQSA